jgi:hypothetical protein
MLAALERIEQLASRQIVADIAREAIAQAKGEA